MYNNSWPVLYHDDDKKFTAQFDSFIDKIEGNNNYSVESIADQYNIPIESLVHGVSCRYFDLGEPEKALNIVADFLKKKSDPLIHSQYLRCLMSHPEATKQQFRDENLKWNELYVDNSITNKDEFFADYDLSPNRKLRLAFLCCYAYTSLFRAAFLPLLKEIDRNNFHVTLFNIGNISSDWLTEGVDECVDFLCPTTENLYNELRKRRVDIIIDLNGRFRIDNPMETLIRRASPIQVSYFNMLGTYGAESIRYIMLDEYALPPQDDKYYTEKVFRFATGAGGTFEIPDAGIGPLPFRNNGYITFGSFNALFKLNDKVLDTWAKILLKVPNSKLFLKAGGITTNKFRERITRIMKGNGLVGNRVTIEDFTPFGDMLQKYNNVDIFLNTFPYTGGTTTAYGLWMGLPSISLEDDEHIVSGGGAGMVIDAGYPDFSVKTIDEYVSKAANLANRPEYLEQIRKEIRSKLAKRARFNPKMFARDFENQCRAIWHDWLKTAQIKEKKIA